MPNPPDNFWMVIPAHNEAGVISVLLEELHADGYRQIIVVDDGSQDNTASVARQAGARVVRHSINRGVGAATQTGLEAARILGAEYVVAMDGDGQHHVHDVAALLAPLVADEADVVIGSRFAAQNQIPLTVRLFNKIANLLTWVLSGVATSDSQSGMRGFGKNALDNLKIEGNGYEFASEMLGQVKSLNLRWMEVPISVSYSDYARGKGQNFINGVETVFRLIIRSLMR